MERNSEYDAKPNERTISTLLGVARVALQSKSGSVVTYGLRLQLEGQESRTSYYVTTKDLPIEETLAFRDACEALGIVLDQ